MRWVAEMAAAGVGTSLPFGQRGLRNALRPIDEPNLGAIVTPMVIESRSSLRRNAALSPACKNDYPSLVVANLLICHTRRPPSED